MLKVLLGSKGNKKSNISGFTLIELLVVVAIIAVLAAILFPVFARARESARRTSCMSNLKQIGLGFMMYAQDYDERFPGPYMLYDTPTPSSLHWSSSGTFWQQLIYPYTKSIQVYVCPSSPDKDDLKYNRLHYGMNGFTVLPYAGVSLSAIQTPASTYMVFDAPVYMLNAKTTLVNGNNSFYIPGAGQSGGTCGATEDSRIRDCESGRHFNGLNMSFMDGHVKWLTSSIVVAEAKEYVAHSTGAWSPKDNEH